MLADALGRPLRFRITAGVKTRLYTEGVFTGCTYNCGGGINEVSVR